MSMACYLLKFNRSIIIVLCIFHSLFSSITHADVINKLSLSIKLERQEDNFYLIYNVTNIFENEISVFLNDLPWYTNPKTFCQKLVIAKAPYKELIEYKSLYCTWGAAERIKPHKTISKKISLNGHFPELKAALNESDVILFWSYLPSMHSKMQNGWLVIPKYEMVDKKN